jgi:sterol 3beta-glucosyltransferase
MADAAIPLRLQPVTDTASTAELAGAGLGHRLLVFAQNASYKPQGQAANIPGSRSTPVFIGFGSMPDANPAGLKEIVVEAIRMTGQRAVVQGEWLCGEMPDNMLAVGWLPHGWLFPDAAPQCTTAAQHPG